MSLSYHSEHLAWKQRVNQELNRATQFYSTFENSVRKSMYDTTAKSRMSKRTRSIGYDGNTRATNMFLNSARLSNTQYSKHDESELKNGKVNLGYSFGGTHNIKNALKEGQNGETFEDSQNTYGIIKPKNNGLVARSSQKTRRVIKKDEDIRVISSRPLSKEQSIKFRSQQKSQSPSVKSVPKSLKEVEEDYDKIYEERGSEDIEEGDQSTDKEVQDDKLSTHSKITTLSQAKYIEELEAKLYQEKLKRMKAELDLKRLSKNY